MKVQNSVLSINSPKGIITIKENVEYSWCKQHGFFKIEDDNIFAWYPGSYEKGTPSYFSDRSILYVCDAYDSIPTQIEK
jgi:hypothetical protein